MRYRYRPPTGLLPTMLFAARRLLAKLNPDREECPPEKPSISFVPGQIVLLAEVVGADNAVPEPQLRKQIAEQLRLDIDRLNLETCVKVGSDQITLLRGAGRTLAVAVGNVPDARLAPRRLLELVRQINRQLPPLRRLKQPRSVTPAQQYDKGNVAKTQREALAVPVVRKQENGLALSTQLQVASPNWLMSGSPKNQTGGGPSARPIPFNPPEANPESKVPPEGTPDPASTESKASPAGTPEPWHISLPSSLSLETQSLQPTVALEVDVVILDTAPTREDFERAWATWGSGHAWLNGLIGVGGKLLDEQGNRRVHYAPYTNLLGVTDIDLEKHPYVISDHGLFVAGIVNEVAPTANLHMVEVLNPYGVGTLQSIADGFAKALEIAAQRPNNRVLVNTSLVMNMPQNKAVLNNAQAYLADLQGMTGEDIPSMKLLLAQLVNLLPQSNLLLIAAAGNDSTLALPHPGARFPAAFDNVVGVSALSDETQPASYSNLADAPVELGIATFGGASDGDSATEAGGIIGIYIGALPNGVPNSSGWARWAGTSFATPIITGALARLAASGPLTNPDPLTVLRNAYTALGDTGVGEVFPVTQG